ncbi:SIMPL domain-containing protein [Acidithiobacillus sp. M4-SHS-6]|uniref:SIMPL domain-containing protein n=1 Tax=Acidithiobacillus sp. M4-SHS-6 TaxID=3383024 RepID=UPI0039BEAE07
MKQRMQLSLWLLLPFSLLASADTGTQLIHLGVRQSYHVANTVMLAQMQASASGPNAADLAQQVNTKMHWALQQLAAEQHLQTQTLNYYTQRDYGDGKPTGWTIKQILQIRGPQSSQLNHVLGKLQSRLELISMSTEPSESARQAAEAQAAKQAITRFKAHAHDFCRDFGYSQSVLDVVRISSTHVTPGPVPMMRMAVQTPVASAPGESAMAVEVSGSVRCLGKK